MALRQTYSSLVSLSSLTLDVAAISMSKISMKPWTQLPSSLEHTNSYQLRPNSDIYVEQSDLEDSDSFRKREKVAKIQRKG